jgi:hypothetical protein
VSNGGFGACDVEQSGLLPQCQLVNYFARVSCASQHIQVELPDPGNRTQQKWALVVCWEIKCTKIPMNKLINPYFI